MCMSVVGRWWLLSAAVIFIICLTTPVLSRFLNVPALNALGLGFKVLPPMFKIAQIDENVAIPCQPIKAKWGAANVTWVRDNKVVSDARHHALPNGTLIIRKMEESDRGIYRCLLSSGNYSVTSAFIYLRQPFTAVWQLKPMNNTVQEGRAIRLECLLASLPEASYIWLKDEKVLPENESRYYLPKPGVLQITNVQKQDQGMFKCQAINPMIKKRFTSRGGYLTVLPRDDDAEAHFQHSLIGVASKVEVQEGEQAVLECITDDENGDLKWSRIDESPIPDNTKYMGQGSLVFQSVKERDTGVYNCTALRKESPDPISTQMIELAMVTPPVVHLSMAVSLRPTALDSEISNGNNVRITCTTWGTPVPSISWYKNGILHVENERHKYSNKNFTKTHAAEDLFIGNVMFKDMGVYQCVTRNIIGVASYGFILKINMSITLPEPPRDLKAVKISPATINLTWTQPSDTNVSEYIVFYRLDSSLTQREQIVNRTSAIITDLTKNSNYIVYVRPFISRTNLIGEPSKSITVSTKDDSYLSNPTKMPEVMLYRISASELLANWTLNEYHRRNIPITEQTIQWRRKTHYLDEKALMPNVTEYVITSLHPNKAYEVRVLVATKSGYPVHKLQLNWYTVKMQRNVSGAPHDAVLLDVHLSTCTQNPTDIVVNWTLADSLQKELRSYSVIYNHSQSITQQEKRKNITSSTISYLATETCYGVRVQANFYNQNSTSSPLKTICTLSRSPFVENQQTNTDRMKVKKLKTKVLNSTSVLIAWKHTSRKLPADFYTIKVESLSPHSWRDEGDEKGLDDLTRDPEESLSNKIRFYRVTNRRLTLTNLRPLHNYSVTVTASTRTLTGHPFLTFVTLDEGVPTPPLNVTWVPASPKDAILTWSPPRRVNGRLINYQVSFSHDKKEWRNKTLDPFPTTTQIEDLVSNTNYTLHIAGVTSKGAGAPTIVFIYIRATLEREPHISTESVAVISVVSFLVIVTCVVAVLLCLRILRLRNNSPSVFQGNGTCRMVNTNGVKSTSRDHGTEPDDYKPMLASLPPAIQNHHLDTKGGPGSHDDGIVANSLFDPSGIQMNQDDEASEGMEPLRDSLSHHRMLDTLDDIEDADDGSKRLLQGVSTAQPILSRNMKEFNSKSMYNTTPDSHHSSDDGAGMDTAVSS